jgi:hypothetical protein
MSDLPLSSIIGDGLLAGTTVIEPTMAVVKRVINNHSANIKSLVQTTSALIELLKEKVTVDVVQPPWWKFWACRPATRVGVFTSDEFAELFMRLKLEAEAADDLALMERQVADALRITNQVVMAGPDSPLCNGGASIETKPDGSMKLVKS